MKDQIVQLRGGFYAKVQVICEKIFQLAQLKPADEDSLAAFSFILKNRGPSKIGLKSLAYVMEHHYDSPMLQPVIKYASYNLDKKTETMLETISKKSKSEEIRAAALFALIDFYVNLKKAQKMPKEDLSESYDAEFVSNYDEESIDVDPIWDRLVDEFGDLYHQGNPIDEYVPIARHLAVGATAPDIEGPDMYGEKFKLSDYRGKVVLLDFWGDW